VPHRLSTTPPVGRLARSLAVLAIALGALTACGDDEPDGGADATSESTSTSAAPSSSAAPTSSAAGTPAPAAQTLTATEADFTISLDSDSLAAGTYQIEVVNDGAMTHALTVERDGADVAASDSIAPGSSATFEVTLEPGTYVFYCPIGNHRAAGMEITVQVT